MTDQMTLPYQAHSATSRDAAESIAPAAGTLRAKVLALLEAAGKAHLGEP